MSLQVEDKRIRNSTYALFVPRDDNTYIVSNGLTGTIAHINEKQYIYALEEVLDKADKGCFVFEEDNELQKFLYESGMLVDEDANDYEQVMYTYEQKLVKDLTLGLVMITSRQCNLRCVYCYEDFNNNYMSDEIYDSTLKLIQNKLSERTCNKVSIGLFGGEPFLPFDSVIKFLRKAKALCDEAGVEFIVSATTNFALVTPERFEMLCEVGCLMYQVTVDGLAHTHDKYRPKSDGKGSYSTIIDNLLAAKKSPHDFKIVIRTNFNDEIFEHVQDFYQFIKQEFNDSRFAIYFESIKKLGGKNDSELNILNDNESNSKSNKIAQLISQLKLPNFASEIFTTPFHGVCYASKHNTFVIDFDGSILKCTVKLDDDSNKIGHLSNSGDLLIDHKKHSCWVYKETKLSSECRNCRVFPICFGGRCVVNSISNTNNICTKSDKKNRQEHIENMLKYCI